MLILSLVAVQGAFRETAVEDSRSEAHKYRACVGQVPPGETRTTIADADHAMHIRFGVEIAFKDAAGRNWVRYGLGGLEEVDQEPTTFYKIPLPVEWEVG